VASVPCVTASRAHLCALGAGCNPPPPSPPPAAAQRVYRATLLGRPVIVKERFAKAYRHPLLDAKLTNSRMAHEVRAIVRARRAGVDTPALLFVDEAASRIFMEDVPGETVKSFLLRMHARDVAGGQRPREGLSATAARAPPFCSLTRPPPAPHFPPAAACTAVMADVGRALARLHDAGLCHGDLTTSNMLLRPATAAAAAAAAAAPGATTPAPAAEQLCHVVLIDFGLSSSKAVPEDLAVDLYVLERAFLSTHPDSEPLFAAIVDAYTAAWAKGPAVAKKLEAVRMRGRKKLAFG
jgi:TP53 regulating kinase-like protein